MAGDNKSFWDEIWSESDFSPGNPDAMLVSETSGLTPGRALEMGCGMGENAIWLAEQGWHVMAVDFSDEAINQARKLASERGVAVDFVAADASEYQPDGLYDLITSFYIHLPPEGRAKMLSNMAKALAPGGVLLFVSHDKSTPPSGWREQDLLSLTTPDEVVPELGGLQIEKAVVVKDEGGAHSADAHEHDENQDHEGHHDHEGHDHSSHEGHESASTVVRASRPRST